MDNTPKNVGFQLSMEERVLGKMPGNDLAYIIVGDVTAQLDVYGRVDMVDSATKKTDRKPYHLSLIHI